MTLGVASCIDRGRGVSHMLLLRGQGTGGARGIRVVRVTGRATKPALALVHGQTGGGRSAAWWSERSAVDGRCGSKGSGAGGWRVVVRCGGTDGGFGASGGAAAAGAEILAAARALGTESTKTLES